MDILIIGSGGREYSIGMALKKDEKVGKLYFSTGNGATDTLGENIDITDANLLADFCEEKNIGLTIVGPEAPLVAGVVDIFKERGLVIFGPSASASRLEGSKSFMKNFLASYHIPTLNLSKLPLSKMRTNLSIPLKLRLLLKRMAYVRVKVLSSLKVMMKPKLLSLICLVETPLVTQDAELWLKSS